MIETERAAVIAEAETWIGTVHHHGAGVKGAGIDCGRFLTEVFGSCGISVPSLEEIGYFPYDWFLHTRENRYLDLLEKYTFHVEAPEPGDIALFAHRKIVFSHSAIVVEWPARVIHVSWSQGCEWADASKTPLVEKRVLFLRPNAWKS